MNRRQLIQLGLATAASAALPFPAFGYPDRPIKLVVPFSAGGVNDIVGRQWAERVKASLGTVFVENVPGAGGTIGVMEVKRADPDGHTLLFGSVSTMVLNEMTRNKLPYNPKKDFVPAAIFTVTTVSLVVNAALPVKNVKELLDYAKANPGKLSYGSAGTGTMSHLAGEKFKQAAGLKDVVHVPYKGAGPGIADIVSGHVPIMTPNVSGQILTLHKSGKLRILAVFSPKRLKAAPEIPTAIEQGVPDMVGQLFLGIYARAETQKAVVDKVADASKQALDDPQFDKALVDAGFEPVHHFGPDAGMRYMAEEHARWKPLVEAIGLKM